VDYDEFLSIMEALRRSVEASEKSAWFLGAKLVIAKLDRLSQDAAFPAQVLDRWLFCSIFGAETM
jgi:hypothetical protein